MRARGSIGLGQGEHGCELLEIALWVMAGLCIILGLDMNWSLGDVIMVDHGWD